MKQVLRNVCTIFLIQICFTIFANGGEWNSTTGSKPDIEDDFENMKPTSLARARRFNAENNATITVSPQKRSFLQLRAKKPHKKKTLDIWKWDARCQRQPVIGRCKQELSRYFYEVSRQECVKFTYSGCDGNANNFESIYDCEKNCKGILNTSPNATITSYCALQPNAGACFDILSRYYYDLNQRKCMKFIYGGCGGNDNNFEYEGECNKACGNVVLQETKEDLREGDNDSSSDSK